MGEAPQAEAGEANNTLEEIFGLGRPDILKLTLPASKWLAVAFKALEKKFKLFQTLVVATIKLLGNWVVLNLTSENVTLFAVAACLV